MTSLRGSHKSQSGDRLRACNRMFPAKSSLTCTVTEEEKSNRMKRSDRCSSRIDLDMPEEFLCAGPLFPFEPDSFDGQTARVARNRKSNQIGGDTGTEHANTSDEAAGILGCHPQCFGQRNSGAGDNTRNPVFQSKRRAGKKLRSGETEASVFVELHFATHRRFVAPGRKSGDGDRIRDENTALGSFGAKDGLQHVARQVVTVGDQGCGEPVVGELRPERVGVPGDHSGAAVAKMRRQPRARIHGAADLFWSGIRVPDRYVHATARQPGDVIFYSLPVRGERHHANQTARGPLPVCELGETGWTDGLFRVGATIALRRADV